MAAVRHRIDGLETVFIHLAPPRLVRHRIDGLENIDVRLP